MRIVMPGETVDTGTCSPAGAQPEVLSSGGGRIYIGFLDEDGLPYAEVWYWDYEEAERAQAGTYYMGLVPGH